MEFLPRESNGKRKRGEGGEVEERDQQKLVDEKRESFWVLVFISPNGIFDISQVWVREDRVDKKRKKMMLLAAPFSVPFSTVYYRIGQRRDIFSRFLTFFLFFSLVLLVSKSPFNNTVYMNLLLCFCCKKNKNKNDIK